MLYFIKKTKHSTNWKDEFLGWHEWMIIFSNGKRVSTSGTLLQAHEEARKTMENVK